MFVQTERPDKEVLLEDLKGDPEKGADLILTLLDRCEKLEDRIKALERNSRNSSKPPSSDIGKPKPNPKSQRKKTGKKPGGQAGHKGSTLELVDNPDHIIINEFKPGSRCQSCGALLSLDHPDCDHEIRQVIDLPAIRFDTTEFRSPKISCQKCYSINTAPFPEEVRARTQYGSSIQATALYLGTYQMIPYQRLQELFDVVFNCPLSQGTLANFIKKGGARAEVAASDIHRKIKAGDLFH